MIVACCLCFSLLLYLLLLQVVDGRFDVIEMLSLGCELLADCEGRAQCVRDASLVTYACIKGKIKAALTLLKLLSLLLLHVLVLLGLSERRKNFHKHHSIASSALSHNAPVPSQRILSGFLSGAAQRTRQ